MKIKINNAISDACFFLNKTDVQILLSGGTGSSEASINELNHLLACTRQVLKQIATDYIPCLFYEDIVVDDSERYAINSLTQCMLTVRSIERSSGGKVSVHQENGYLILKKGNYHICYSYLPTVLDTSEEYTDFDGAITERVVAYGIVAEYFILSGQYDDAYIWERRFKDGLTNATKRLDNIVMGARQWR